MSKYNPIFMQKTIDNSPYFVYHKHQSNEGEQHYRIIL